MLVQKFVCRLAAAPFCLIPGSHRLLFAHKRRQKALLSRLCSRGKRNSLSAISTPRFSLRQIPRLAGLGLSRPIAARYLWDILSGAYLPRQGRPTPGMLSVNWQRPPKAGGRKAQDCGRERACNLAPKAQPVAPGGERVIHIRRGRRRDGKKRFWCLLGLWPKGTAAQHPCVIVRKVIAPHTRTQVCLPNRKRRRLAKTQSNTL